METVKVILNFFNCAIYFDYKKFGVVIQLNILRKCIFDNFNETVPKNKIIETQSIIDNIIFKKMKMRLQILLTRFMIYEKILY